MGFELSVTVVADLDVWCLEGLEGCECLLRLSHNSCLGNLTANLYRGQRERKRGEQKGGKVQVVRGGEGREERKHLNKISVTLSRSVAEDHGPLRQNEMQVQKHCPLRSLRHHLRTALFILSNSLSQVNL